MVDIPLEHAMHITTLSFRNCVKSKSNTVLLNDGIYIQRWTAMLKAKDSCTIQGWKKKMKKDRKRDNSFYSASLHIRNTMQNTWLQDVPMILKWLPCRNALISQLSHFLTLSLPSLLFPLPPCTHAVVPQQLCCPWAWMPTYAGWGCRAQLGLIAAVYLIKTREDPTGARAQKDRRSIYGFEHRCASIHNHLHTQGDQGRREARLLPFISRDQVPSECCVFVWGVQCKAHTYVSYSISTCVQYS